MITLHILQLLADNGLGTIAIDGTEPNADLWFEKLPVGKTGVFIMSRGLPLSRGARIGQSFDLYSRGVNDIQGAQRLEAMLEFFRNSCYPACDLPPVEGISYNSYRGVTIVPTSNIENVGQDETDRVIYVASAEIRYNKEL